MRRIAPKEELKSDPQKSDTNILPSTRRISLKSKKPDIKAELVPEPPKRLVNLMKLTLIEIFFYIKA